MSQPIMSDVVDYANYYRDEADKLKRELDGLRKDKERYEWLKSGVGSNWAYWHLHGNPCITDSFIDAAVTAYDAKKGGGT